MPSKITTSVVFCSNDMITYISKIKSIGIFPMRIFVKKCYQCINFIKRKHMLRYLKISRYV